MSILLPGLSVLQAAAAPLSPEDTFIGWTVGTAAGGQPTVFCTTNGQDWFRQGLGQIPAVNLEGVASRGPHVWIVGDVDGGYASIYHSADDGASWTRQGDAASLPSAELIKCRAVDTQVVWAVGFGGEVVRTANGGADWIRVPVAGFTNPLQAVTAVDAQTAWVGGHVDSARGYAGLFHTTNGGATWTQQTVGGITNIDHLLGLHAVDAQTVWGTGGDHQDVIATTNGGAEWRQAYRGASLRDGNEIRVAPDGAVWVATDSTLFWSTNAGANWISQGVGDYTMDVDTPDGRHVWAVRNGWHGDIYYSPDGGATWTNQVAADGFPGLGNLSMQRRPKAFPPGTRYVWPDSPASAAPHDSWETAAHALQAAVDVAAASDRVVVADGIYLLAAPVAVTQEIHLASLNGVHTVVLRATSNRCLEVSGPAIVEGLILTNGYSAESGGGACLAGGATLKNCVVAGGQAGGNGGGVWAQESRVVNCLVAGNRAAVAGGGIHAATSEVYFCTFAANDAPAGGGLYLDSGSAAVDCIAWSNMAANVFVDPLAAFDDSLADADPEWRDPARGDFRLRYGSPAIDAGVEIAGVDDDPDGVPRPQDGDWDGTNDFDLGCFEYDPATADSNQDGVPDWWYHAYELDPASAATTTNDPDVDGFPNKDEWIALTHPNDDESYFRVAAVAAGDGTATISFDGSAQRVYSLQSRTNLLGGDEWNGVPGQINVAGQDGATTLFGDSFATQNHYRVGVALP